MFNYSNEQGPGFVTLQGRKNLNFFRDGHKGVVNGVFGVGFVAKNLVGHVEHEVPVGLVEGHEGVPVLRGVDGG